MGSGRPRRGPFWALAVLALASIALIARSVPHDGPDRQAVSIRAEVSALRSGHLWLALAACAATTGGVLSAYSFISPLLSDRTGLAAGLVPLVLVGFGVGALVGTLLGGRLGDRHPYATTVAAPAATTVLLLAICLLRRYDGTAREPLCRFCLRRMRQRAGSPSRTIAPRPEREPSRSRSGRLLAS